MRAARSRSIAVPGAGSATLELQIPKGFEVRESTVVMNAADSSLKDPRAIQAQTTVRANVVVRRLWGPGPTLADLAAQLTQDLASKVAGLTEFETSDFMFDSGVPGYKVSYRFQPVPMFDLRQVHVLAVDAEGAMYFTLTLAAQTTPETLKQHLASIAGTRLTKR